MGTNYVSFPGLGIEPFKLDPVAVELFGRPVMWYGVIICLGMILAFAYVLTRAKIEKIKTDDIIDLGIFLIIFGILGARLYYVMFTLDSYIVEGNILQTLYGMIAIWNGGLAIYGGVIAGFITILVYARIKKMRFSTLLDVVAPGVIIGQTVGRWGNFMNSEAYGGETTLPWRMGLHSSFDGEETFYSEIFVHPTFLYESVWNLIGFAIIAVFYKKKKFNGQVFLFYMSWYGLGRAIIEGLRTDSLMLGPIRVSQLFAGLTFILGVSLMAWNLINVARYKKHSAEGDTTDTAELCEANSGEVCGDEQTESTELNENESDENSQE